MKILQQCSPERVTVFDNAKRDELNAGVEVEVRAYESYEYFTNFFPDREERIKAIRDMNHCAQRTIFGKTSHG